MLQREFFNLILFIWRKIALQCCVRFCHTIMQISRNYTYITSLLSLSPLPQTLCSRSSLSTRLSSLCYKRLLTMCICFTYGSVFMSRPLSLLISLYNSPTVSTSPFSISVSPFLLCE